MGLAGHLESRQKWFVSAVLALLVILALEMFLSARLESQIFDEPAHLYAATPIGCTRTSGSIRSILLW
jgi:CHASE2 domain-containing sensor protein